jgi:hypothetical protein
MTVQDAKSGGGIDQMVMTGTKMVVISNRDRLLVCILCHRII